MISCRKNLLIPFLLLWMGIQPATAIHRNTSHDKSRQLVREGLALKKSGQLLAARERFLTAIQADANCAAAYSELGDSYFAGKDYQHALQYSLRAKQLGVNTATTIIGLSYYHLQQYDNALEVLQDAIQEHPDNGLLLQKLAQIQGQLGNYRESIHYYQRALTIDSSHAESWYQLGMMYFNDTDYPAATRAFDKAILHGYDQQALFCFHAGVAAMQCGQLDKSIQLLTKASALDPDNEQVLFNLAHANYRKENYPAAVDAWKAVLKHQPGNAFALFMLGKSYMGAGEKEKGERICDQAQQMPGL
ncbi:tetratricopeptide repeat protein [Chitinophaga dinghuensis]|uniref:Tetratricopeptide repeat protein n=1 Tax=Chitinophaga dinghuensis TaxID=1539050 RepID=A0A327W662_9BACT|nr:tetratricopeptide repeat protein [Chitinophaga dinghuensis]RAJ83504.1 tetratricopeptide repeat protein [Chitinophaga dinghuensis]